MVLSLVVTSIRQQGKNATSYSSSFTLPDWRVIVGQMIIPTSGTAFFRNGLGPTLVASIFVVFFAVLNAPVAQAENWDRYNGWEITSFKVQGLPPDVSSGFQNQLALHGQRKLLGMKRPVFKTRLLAEDLARIRLYLAQNGYPVAKTFPTAEVKNDSRQLALLITIDPGKAVLLRSIEVVGWPERVAFPDTTRKGVLFKGQVFSDANILSVEEHLRNRLLDSGFEAAATELKIRNFNNGQVDLFLEVNAGPYSVVDSLRIEGCSEDLIPVARRVMDWKSGREYSSEWMRQAALDLRSTQLFGHVELNTENLKPGSLMLNTTLENARMKTWQAGVGTWSDNPWMVRMGWAHNNLFKHGIGFNVSGLFGEYEQSLGANVYWLGWLTPRSRTSFGFIVESEKEDAFQSLEERVELVQSFRPNLRDIWKIGISVSQVDVENFTPDPDEAPDAQGQMLEIWSDWKWDRTNDPLSPTSGHYIKVSGTVSPPWVLSESPYWQLQLDGVRFTSLTSKIILAGRMRAGASAAMGGATDLLANRRFFAGGYNTMRGYERRNLGPKDMAGDPRGGKFVSLAGLEVRFPLVWSLAGAVFMDSGQVWRDSQDVSIASISGAAGVALDLITPLGPLRVSYAANVLNRQVDEPHDMWLFGIGYPW